MALSVNPMAQQPRQVNQAFLETNMWSKSIATLLAFFMAIVLTACGGGTETVGGNTTQTPTLVAQTLAAQTALTIDSQPVDQTITAGQTATFSVTATGIAPLTYQWRKNGTNISGATSSSYTTPAISSADNGAVFTVVVSNSTGTGTVTSNNATITVTNARYSLVANASGGTYALTECVKDTTTGLVWEGKTASPATSRLGILTYFNYDSTSSAQKWNGSAYVNPTQAEIDAGTNSIGYRNSVNASALCGYTDWRLPTKEELEGIVLRGTSPTIDTMWFPNTQARFYWSSSPYVGNSGSAWGVNFDYGNVNFTGRSINLRVRLVRNSAAPSIATQPRAQTVTAGQTATFSVTATGIAPLTYQWRKNGTNISGATSSSYTTPATAIGDSGAVFTVVVSNSVGTVTSSSATLTVSTSRYSLVANASGGTYDKTECVQDNTTGLMWEGKTASPATSRLGILTYFNYDSTSSAQKWNGSAYVNPTQAEIDAGTNSIGYRNSVNASALCGYTDWRLPTKEELEGIVLRGTSPTIDTMWFPNTQARFYWSSSPYVGNSGSAWGVNFDYGNVNFTGRSINLRVRLVRNSPAPSITTQPAAQTVTAGQTASFSVTASGTAPLSYQWKKNGTDISGATSSSYTTPVTVIGDNGATFTVVVSNSVGTATSNSATLTVNAAVAPAITTQPAAQTVTAGQTASFSVTASGTAPLSYQWKKNGTDISGATASSYTTPATTSADNNAVFTVVVSNSAGTVTSSSATLTVTSAVASTPKPPHSGVTASQCYQAGSNTLVSCSSSGAQALNSQQDGNRTSINARSYSLVPNASGGTYAITECVKDNITGLVWEGKTASGTRAGSNTYTNYDSTASAQKPDGTNPTQAEIDASTNSMGYRNAVRTSALCGFTDWRLPTVKELQTLVNYGVASPWPNHRYNVVSQYARFLLLVLVAVCGLFRPRVGRRFLRWLRRQRQRPQRLLRPCALGAVGVVWRARQCLVFGHKA